MDYYSMRPSITIRELNKMFGGRKRFDRQVANIDATLDELHEQSSARHRRSNIPELKSPYSLFLDGFYAVIGETAEQRRDRYTLNYIRHELTDYDEQIEQALAWYYIPPEWFDILWRDVGKSIVATFPELDAAFQRGVQAKRAYAQVKNDGYAQVRNGVLDASGVWYESRAQAAAAEKAREAAWQQQVDDTKAERRTLDQNVSAYSQLARAVMRVGDELQCYYRGRMYNGTITKLNKVTGQVQFELKNGEIRERKYKLARLYEDNRERLPAVDGIPDVIEFPESSYY